ncbi:uncharacterized protein LOC106883691 isoform X2 [Octopus bimaculoides]|uniref:uncharacterized protein LOC106883691 isoform X2 n=1 Tax=Octopus bimaculoides TaxID=37653 RepID=UPI0022E01FE1|nr:uncharacterized protein LOC106883691 isoform X2 [Octopus bimaculoides]
MKTDMRYQMDSSDIHVKDTPASMSSMDMITKDSIIQQAQELIDEVNDKRKHDELFSEYRKQLEKHVEKRCITAQQQMVAMYEEHGRLMEEKLKKLFSCLDRVGKAESELMAFKQSLAMLYQEMQLDIDKIKTST